MIVLAISAPALNAQSSDQVVPLPAASPAAKVKKAEESASGKTRITSDPLLSSGVRNARPNITAIATAADKTAKAQFGSGYKTEFGFLQIHVSASTPLSEGADKSTRVSVADLSDLQGVSSGEFGTTLTYWKSPSPLKLALATQLYARARKKLSDAYQTAIDFAESHKVSTTDMKNETALNVKNLAAIDSAVTVQGALIQQALRDSRSANAATAAAGLQSLGNALSARAGLQIER
ncbi:MAG: hypothetical protein ABI852_12890, partial [Gemmatimonadaceae bacterium]